MRIRYAIALSLAFTVCATFSPEAVFAQARGTVVGRVTEAASGVPLPGANVVINGTTIGVSTDRNGRFRLRGVPVGTQTLTASFVGFVTADTTLDVRAEGPPIEVTFTLDSQVLQSGEVVVTGLREGELRAINQKRQALNVIDVLSADEIGKLPELNVAEAVQRLPGIVIQTSRGEGRFVSIRGSQANLNNVTLNGQSMASTAESRATALDLLPAEMVSSVEVTKAVTPDMDGNAVGGTVNINTLTAFDRSGPFAFGSIRGLRHDQQSQFNDEKFPFRGSLTAGTQFGARDQFGIVVSGNVSRRDFTATEANINDWVPLSEFVEGGESETFLPEEVEPIVEDNERTRYGLTANFDFRPSPQTTLFARGYYTHTDETDLNSEYEYGFPFGGLEMLTATSGRFSRGLADIDVSFDDEAEDLWGFAAGGERVFGALRLSVDGTYTRGTLDRFNRDAEFIAPLLDDVRSGVNLDQLAAFFDTRNRFVTLEPENPAFVRDPANYQWVEFDRESETNTEDTFGFSTDLRWDVGLGSYNGFIKTGASARVRDKVIDDIEREFRPPSDPTVITLDQFALPTPGVIQGGTSQYVTGDILAFEEFFQSNQDNESIFRENVGESATEAVENDSDNREGVYAGYVMGSVRLGSLEVLGGARVEHTRTESRRFRLVEEPGAAVPTITSQTFNTDYTNVLPSIHLKYSAVDNLIFRGAWSNTIGRADYEQLAGFSEVEIEEIDGRPGVFVAGIEEGNPNLRPFKAMNVDVFAEYYFQPGGLLSIGGFYKRIEDTIYGFSSLERDVENPFGEGRFFDAVGFFQLRNANTGHIRGLEVTYRQPLTFLPAPLDGLGITSDVAVISSDIDVPERDDELPFFEQSDLIYNIIPYYQKGGLEVRLAFHFQSEYLDDVEGSPSEDIYVDDYSTVDLTGSFDFGRAGLVPGSPKLIVQVRNLTNAAEVAYQGIPGRLDNHVLTGRTVEIGLSVGF